MVKQAKNNELGDLLKQWRGVRGRSQLDISLDAGISQRQMSFIESGRSVPSRSTLMGLAQVLEVPLRERNALLLAAGYAPLYSEAAWNSSEMHSIRRALERMVAQHEPYPAIVMDRYWNVFLTNDAAPRFFSCFIDLPALPSPRNLLHLLFDPQGDEAVRRQLGVPGEEPDPASSPGGRGPCHLSEDQGTGCRIARVSGSPIGEVGRDARRLADDAGQLRQGWGDHELFLSHHHGRDSANHCRPGAQGRMHVPRRHATKVLHTGLLASSPRH